MRLRLRHRSPIQSLKIVTTKISRNNQIWSKKNSRRSKREVMQTVTTMNLKVTKIVIIARMKNKKMKIT